MDASKQPPNVLIVLTGSPANQKTRSVVVRFGGGSAKGAFEASLADLAVICKNLRSEESGI